MKKLERIFLLPNIFEKSDPNLMAKKVEETSMDPPKIKVTDKFIIPKFTFNDSKNNTKILFDQLSTMDDKDVTRQLSIIVKSFVQKIQELKSKSNSIVTVSNF